MTRSRRWARAVSSVRREASSLARRLETCRSTVRWLMKSRVPISRSGRPSATRAEHLALARGEVERVVGRRRASGAGERSRPRRATSAARVARWVAPIRDGDRVRVRRARRRRVRGRPRASRASAPRIRAYAARYGSGAASQASATREPVRAGVLAGGARGLAPGQRLVGRGVGAQPLHSRRGRPRTCDEPGSNAPRRAPGRARRGPARSPAAEGGGEQRERRRAGRRTAGSRSAAAMRGLPGGDRDRRARVSTSTSPGTAAPPAGRRAGGRRWRGRARGARRRRRSRPGGSAGGR